ncbi:MAG TPA: ABC transporter permease subunit [Dehalococcoidia bacterium]|nr:ABC transporter permease subunit [Dehalococcoidia bacterium]
MIATPTREQAPPRLGRPWHRLQEALPGWLRRHLAAYLLLLPACALVFGLIVYPLLYTVWLSFTSSQDFYGPGAFNGLANYREVLSDRTFWEAVRNTVVLTAITIALELVLAVATALLLWWRFWGRSLVFLVVFVPWVFPAAFSGFAWMMLLKPPFHTFYTLQAVQVKDTLEGLFGPSAYYFATIVTFNVWRCSSFVAVFLLAGLNGIPRELLEYARLESGSAWQRFRLVIAPLVRRYLVLAVLTSIVITFMDYTIVYVQTGGLIFQPLLGTLAYRTGIEHGQTGLGAAINVLQFPFVAALLFIGFRFFEREPRPHVPERSVAPLHLQSLQTASLPAQPAPAATRAAPAAPAPRQGRRVAHYRLRRGVLLALGSVAALVLAVFHILPIYWTLISSIRPLTENTDGNPFWALHPSLTGLTEPLRDQAFWTWMQNTAVIFGVALVVALVASLLAGYALARLRPPGARWTARLLLASYFVPQIAVLVPVYQLFIWLGISDTFLAVILLYETLTVPFCTWLFYTHFTALSPDTEEAALLDGTRVQAFLRLTLRMSWPVIIAAGVFCVGMMASDLLYAGTFLIHHDQQTVTVGLAVISLDLGEFTQATGAIGIAALPIVLICLLFAPSYVRGLTMAMDEGA